MSVSFDYSGRPNAAALEKLKKMLRGEGTDPTVCTLSRGELVSHAPRLLGGSHTYEPAPI